jgi:hypothetical protein
LLTSTSTGLLASALALYGPKGLGPYLRQHFLDKTFQGLYHANAFDYALLIPYFIVLILLASYGLHRYVLVYLYYKNRAKHTVDPPAYFEDLRIARSTPSIRPLFLKICPASPSSFPCSTSSMWPSASSTASAN